MISRCLAKELYTEIEIAAGAGRVWEIITGFEKYPEWNPFIRKVEGKPVEGSQLEIHLTTPSGTSRTYRPKVTRVEQEKELRWYGKVPGFLSGEHVFTIEGLAPDRVRLVHREVFGGLLVPFFGKSLDTDVRQGFEEMNRALKKRAEG